MKIKSLREEVRKLSKLLNSQQEEIESLREQLAAIEEYKQELRKANNEFGSETECWPDLWKRISELKRIHGQEYVNRLEAENEIESLRTALESACNERDLAQNERDDICRDIEMQNRELGEHQARWVMAERERDEWKRRAHEVIDTYCHICGALPNTPDWFEEE